MTKKIMATSDLSEIKALGRQVTGFRAERWLDNREAILQLGVALKFAQNPELRELLVRTGSLYLVEASSTGDEYGVGRSADELRAGMHMRGQNILGKAIMSVRASFAVLAGPGPQPVACRPSDFGDEFSHDGIRWLRQDGGAGEATIARSACGARCSAWAASGALRAWRKWRRRASAARLSGRRSLYLNFGTAQTRVRLVIATQAIIRLLHEVPASVRVSVGDAFRSAGVEWRFQHMDSKPQTQRAGAMHHTQSSRYKFFDTRVCTKLVSPPPPPSLPFVSLLSSSTDTFLPFLPPLSYLSPLHTPSLGLSSHLLVAPPSRSQPPPPSPLPWSPSRHLRVPATASEVNSAARPDGFAARDPTASPRPSPPLPPHYPASFGIRRNRCARRSTHHQSPR